MPLAIIRGWKAEPSGIVIRGEKGGGDEGSERSKPLKGCVSANKCVRINANQ